MSFPTFSGADTCCTKCSAGAMRVRYVTSTCVITSGQHSQPPVMDNAGTVEIPADDNPHLCRQCQNCGYTLDESCADA